MILLCPFACWRYVRCTRARFACGIRPAMAAVQLFGILPLIKPTNQMASSIFGFLDWV